jgi:hypothetical protein
MSNYFVIVLQITVIILDNISSTYLKKNKQLSGLEVWLKWQSACFASMKL